MQTHTMLSVDLTHHATMAPAAVSPHLLAHRKPVSPCEAQAAPPTIKRVRSTGGTVRLALAPGPMVESKVAGVSSPPTPATQLMAHAIAPASTITVGTLITNTILALVTASDGVCDKAPVLEFRLKAGSDNDATATHRVRAYVFNQTVSEGAPLFKDSSVCGGRSHLFDLGALNLAYYGASAWEVATVGALPRGGVSMVMLDSDGTCERFEVGTVAPFRPGHLPTLGGFTATVVDEPSKIRLLWAAPTAVLKPAAVKRAVAPAPAYRAVPQSAALPHLGAGDTEALGQMQQALAGMSAFLPLAPSKSGGTRGIGKRSKISKRMAATLTFFFDRDHVRDSGPRAKQSAPSRPVRVGVAESSRPLKAAKATAAHMAEVEGGSDEDTVMDLLAAMMEEEEEGTGHARDAFDLADCLVNEFTRGLPTEAIPMPHRESSLPMPPPLMLSASMNLTFAESPSMLFSQSPFDAELLALMV